MQNNTFVVKTWNDYGYCEFCHTKPKECEDGHEPHCICGKTFIFQK